jgi:hypothetical protein
MSFGCGGTKLASARVAPAAPTPRLRLAQTCGAFTHPLYQLGMRLLQHLQGWTSALVRQNAGEGLDFSHIASSAGRRDACLGIH